MSSPSSNASADIGILAQNQPNSDDASSASEEPEFTTSRFDVYESIEYGADYCGNFCCADIADGSTTSPALPSIVGLRIRGVGNVPLPISDHHVSEIKKRATSDEEEAGSGEVYEIDASKINIDNPQWDDSIKKLVETVAYKLGVNPSFVTAAKLDKLIYMEKGVYVERCYNHFRDLGTLLVQLPSKFSGGELTIYNSVEEEEEEEESFKFMLGAGEEATYSCHFACHFSDCEYEMAKLRSGSRVFLRYSLLYKFGYNGQGIPKASLIHESLSPFKRSLNGLPPADRMVLIPLEKEYDGLDLVNTGITALSRKHRQKAEALLAAGEDWELLIVNAKLAHTCCTYGAHSDDTSIINVFDESGSRVTEEMSWLTKTIDFSSIEHDDGMLLAFDHEDLCVSNWGACKSRSDTYEPEQTYQSTFLLSYDPEFEMELKCLGGCEEVAEVCKKIVETRDYGLFDRLLSVVETKEKCKFDDKSCQILLQMLIKSRKNTTSRVALISKIITGLSSSVEPDELLYDTIIDAVEKLGHDELGNAIGGLLSDPVRKRNKDIGFFLKRMEFALKLNKRVEGEAGLNYLEATINDLSRYAYTYLANSAANVNTILSMISTYDDTDLSSVVEACLNFFHRGTAHQSLHSMMSRTHLLKQLLATNKFGPLQSSLVEFAADFARSTTSISRHDVKTTLEGEGKDMFIQAAAFLIEFGTQNDFDRFGKLSIESVDLFSAFIDAIMSVSGQVLLGDVLNKCLVQYSITDRDASIRNWTVSKPGEPDILPIPSLHVQKVLELCPSIVQTVDKDKRLPLHCAAGSATASFDVIMEVFKACEDAASIRDPMTGLFPFQLAASNGNFKASYTLLLANPNLVSSGIKVSDRKRKRSSSAT